MPPKNQLIMDSLNRERPALYLPKQSPEPKSKATMPMKKQSPSPVAPQVVQFVEEIEAVDPKDLVDMQLNEMQDRIDERDPKLYVDVNIGKSGMERIVVYEGDTAESLAE
jgi:type IV secretory pathway ATPase VirB11/archaellum biosynthesis ATPase